LYSPMYRGANFPCTWNLWVPRIGETFKDRSVWGPVDGRSWLWWVIDNVVWTDSWRSIAGGCCALICVGAGGE
jgi:hypothetical protein